MNITAFKIIGENASMAYGWVAFEDNYRVDWNAVLQLDGTIRTSFWAPGGGPINPGAGKALALARYLRKENVLRRTEGDT